MATTIKDFSESLPLLHVLHEDIKSWKNLERVHTGESQIKIYTTYHNSRRIRWHKGASLSLYVIFVYIPTPLSFLRIERLPISRIPVAVQFLTSAPCCTLHTAQDYNALQSFTVKTSMYYTLSLAVIQSQTPADWFSSSLLLPACAATPPQQEDFHHSSYAAVTFRFGLCSHDMHSVH